MPAKTYSISQTAKILSLSKDTLRYYDKIGLTQPTRGENNYRYYTDFDLLLLQYVEVMRSIGLSLSQIGVIMHDTIEHTEENRRNALNILKDKHEELRRKILFYQGAEHLMAQIIQDLDVMSCPTDMERVDQMIKVLYTRMIEDNSVRKRKEGMQNE